MDEQKLTLVEHLSELRGRLIKSVIFIIVCSFVVYGYIDKLMVYLLKPVGGLIFIAPQEAFISYIKLTFFGGLFLSSPFVIYQLWRFVSDGLMPNESKYVLVFAPLSFIFFIIGASFGYIIIVPIGMKFLLAFGTELIIPMITISKYISFISTLSLAFAMVFQLPLLSLFLTKIGVITPLFLSSKRRHAIVCMFIAAAMLTPPDVITQTMMAVPLIMLYEIGIIFSKLVYRRKQ